MLKKLFFMIARFSGFNSFCEYFLDNDVFIVGYHSVFSDVNTDSLLASTYPSVSLSMDIFEKQIKFLIDHHHTIIQFEDLPKLQQLQIRKPTIVYFDDGFKDNISNVLPILKKYKIKSTFFVVPKYADSGDVFYMNWSDIRELYREGMEIGSHTYNHTMLTKVDSQVLKEELLFSKEKIEREINHPIKVFSYPKGRVDDTVARAVKEVGYEYAITTKYGTNSLTDISANRYFLKKIAPRVYESIADFKVRLYSFNMFR